MQSNSLYKYGRNMSWFTCICRPFLNQDWFDFTFLCYSCFWIMDSLFWHSLSGWFWGSYACLVVFVLIIIVCKKRPFNRDGRVSPSNSGVSFSELFVNLTWNWIKQSVWIWQPLSYLYMYVIRGFTRIMLVWIAGLWQVQASLTRLATTLWETKG